MYMRSQTKKKLYLRKLLTKKLLHKPIVTRQSTLFEIWNFQFNFFKFTNVKIIK